MQTHTLYRSMVMAETTIAPQAPAAAIPTVRIMCPNLRCRSILVVPVAARGKNVKCSNCASLFRIPAAGVTAVPAPRTV